MQTEAPNRDQRDRSALVYLLALGITCVALLILAPVALAPLALIALAALAFVRAKAGIRTGRWLWLRPGTVLRSGEKAAWSASLVVLAFGIVAMTHGAMLVRSTGVPLTFTLGLLDPDVGTRAVTYSDRDTLQAVKEALETAGVPHTVDVRDGKEWITWKPKDNDAAEKVMRAVTGGPLPNGRNMSFGDAGREAQFTDWLTRRGVPYRRVNSHGKSFIVWEGDETSETLMDAFDRDQLQRLRAQPTDCFKTTPKASNRTDKKGC